MTEAQEQKLALYAEIKRKIKKLEAEATLLKEDIEGFLPDDGVSSDLGKFYFTSRTSWTYSGDVDKLKAKLKAQQQLEQKDGTAVKKVSKSMTFKPS